MHEMKTRNYDLPLAIALTPEIKESLRRFGERYNMSVCPAN
jgi:hypothetical protein